MKTFHICQSMGRFVVQLRTIEGLFEHKIPCRTLREAMQLQDFLTRHRKTLDMKDFVLIDAL